VQIAIPINQAVAEVMPIAVDGRRRIRKLFLANRIGWDQI